MAWWKRKIQEQRRKYEFIGSWESQGGSFYVEVDESGKVTAWGNPLRSAASSEFVHLVLLPNKWGAMHGYDICVPLESLYKGSTICVTVKLTVIFNPIKWEESLRFDPQDVYDEITVRGYEGLEDMIKGEFLKEAQGDLEVQRAFANYAGQGHPLQFVGDLGNALRALNFNGQPLKVIKEIGFHVELDTVKVVTDGVWK